MAIHIGPTTLAPVGSTGNNNHTSAALHPGASRAAIAFLVEAAGATPTVTYKLQGTISEAQIADGSAVWFDLMLLPSDSETAAATRVVTATGTTVSFLAQANIRFARRVRLVTSANTNVTYSATLTQEAGD